MFAHFVNTFTHRLHIAQVTELDLTQAFDKAQPGQSILQAFEPVGKLFETFYRVSDVRNVIERLHTVKRKWRRKYKLCRALSTISQINCGIHARELGALKQPLVNGRSCKSCEKYRFPRTAAMCFDRAIHAQPCSRCCQFGTPLNRMTARVLFTTLFVQNNYDSPAKHLIAVESRASTSKAIRSNMSPHAAHNALADRIAVHSDCQRL